MNTTTKNNRKEFLSDPIEDLHIALSLARGNSPSYGIEQRLQYISFYVERVLRRACPIRKEKLYE